MSCVRLLMLLLTGNQQYSKWSASFLSLQRTHLTDRDKGECTLPVTIYDFSNYKTVEQLVVIILDHVLKEGEVIVLRR